MAQYYFDIETYGTHSHPHPSADKIITIQYQQLSETTGEAIGNLVILKEWESSEEDILKKFVPIFRKWEFIPVGNNLKYERWFLTTKAKDYGITEIAEYQLNYGFPMIDIHSLFVMLNKGQFKGSGIHNFTEKEFDGSYIQRWYKAKEYGKIEEYIKNEAESFIKFYSILMKELPKLPCTQNPGSAHKLNEK